MFDLSGLTNKELEAFKDAIAYMVERARAFGLDPSKDEISKSLLEALADRAEVNERRQRPNADDVEEAVQKVAGRVQGQQKLDEINAHGREPRPAELFAAGYHQAKEVPAEPQEPDKNTSPLKRLDYYYRHLSTSAEKKE